MVVHIMRGLPGSGKSTLAKTFGCPIYSADTYHINAEGVYVYNPKKVRWAHDMARLEVIRALKAGRSCTVDNTHIERDEYMLVAEVARMFGHNVEIHIPETPWAWDPTECFHRNNHGVPLETIEFMKARWEA